MESLQFLILNSQFPIPPSVSIRLIRVRPWSIPFVLSLFRGFAMEEIARNGGRGLFVADRVGRWDGQLLTLHACPLMGKPGRQISGR